MTALGTGAFDLVMFDLDGTLVETAPEIQDAVNDTLQRFGLEPVALADIERWIGHGTKELLVQALAQRCNAGKDEVLRSDLLELVYSAFKGDYERRCGSRSRLYPGVPDALAALGARGVKRVLVTNKERRFTDAVLRRHGLNEMLDGVVCGDTLPTRKPDPAGVLQCMHDHATPPRRALFVGDSSIDIETARNAGVAVWAVTYGYNMGSPIAEWRPDRLIDDFNCFLETSTT
jgi:phosphoglycolate phosphatase